TAAWSASSIDVRSRSISNARPTGGGWRDHLLWLLLLALVPLAISTFAEGRSTHERLEETLSQHPELIAKLESDLSKDDFFAALPDHRIVGAHLPAETWRHWGYAAFSATLFLALLALMLPNDSAGPGRILVTGIITGTVGILLLLA